MLIKKPYKAVVLHSGGLDSSSVLALACKTWGPKNVLALSADYGQRHIREINASELICHKLGCDHTTMSLSLPNSMLTDKSQAIPNISYDQIEGVSPTYVPFRNGTLLSHAAAIAQACGAEALYTGVHAEDAKNWAYPDCTPEFFGGMANAIYIGTYHQVRLIAPLLFLTKAETVSLGYNNGAPLEDSWSCYAGGELHCGTCPTCRARHEAFIKAGYFDPTAYATPFE